LELSCIPSFLDLWISFFGETAARNVQLKGTLGSSENGDDSLSLKVLNSMANNGNMQTNLELLELGGGTSAIALVTARRHAHVSCTSSRATG
jgi:hypothetical protein